MFIQNFYLKLFFFPSLAAALPHVHAPFGHLQASGPHGQVGSLHEGVARGLKIKFKPTFVLTIHKDVVML